MSPNALDRTPMFERSLYCDAITTFDAIGALFPYFDADFVSTIGSTIVRLVPIIGRLDSVSPIGILLDVAVELIFEWVFF